jgi:integrase
MMTALANEPMTLLALLELRLQDEESPLRKISVKTYRQSINRFAAFLERTPTVLDLRDDRLARWVAAMTDSGAPEGTSQGCFYHVRALWAWAVQQGLMTREPTLKHVGRIAKMRGKDIDYDAANPSASTNESPLLLDVYENEYKPGRLRSRSDSTLRLYAICLRMFDRSLGRPARLTDFNDATVSKYMRYRRDNGASANTANRDLVSLLAIWRWANHKGYVSTWPDVELEKVPKRTPRGLTKKEIAKLFQAARDEDRPVGNVPGGLWWPALLLICWDTGERIGGVLGLTWDCCDLTEGWVTFRAESRKGGREDNTMRIAADTIEALSKLPRSGRRVFHWPYGKGYVYHRYDRILQRAELPTTREFKFHCVRKSMASWLEAAGGNATETLRHSNRRVTEAYIDPRITKRKAAVDLLFRPEA